MDAFDIRRANLDVLIERVAATTDGKNTTIAARLGDIGPSYLSQLKAGKRMGDQTARKIEDAQGLPRGWMDVTHSNQKAMRGGVQEPVATYGAPMTSEVLLPDERALLLNYRASTDAGRAIALSMVASIATLSPRSTQR